jgi:diaminohydroxyphosphoribosylaminopyrimidine deaminase/5-amino-6-(5-phosphoribosylamino)uracil reductase
VAGKGIEMMKKKGIRVTIGVLERESRDLNRRFFTFHEKKRPYVILKWAQTLDGFIDADRTKQAYGQPTWITNQLARRAVHRQRSTEEAILIGSQTALKDNPSLTLRDWAGEQPKRIVVDRKLNLPKTLHLFNTVAPTVVLNEFKNEHTQNIQYLQLTGNTSSASSILEALYSLNLQSLIVEGGKRMLDLFISSGFWDEAHVYVGNNWFYKGIKAPSLHGKLTHQRNYANSRLFVYRNKL